MALTGSSWSVIQSSSLAWARYTWAVPPCQYLLSPRATKRRQTSAACILSSVICTVRSPEPLYAITEFQGQRKLLLRKLSCFNGEKKKATTKPQKSPTFSGQLIYEKKKITCCHIDQEKKWRDVALNFQIFVCVCVCVGGVQAHSLAGQRSLLHRRNNLAIRLAQWKIKNLKLILFCLIMRAGVKSWNL